MQRTFPVIENQQFFNQVISYVQEAMNFGTCSAMYYYCLQLMENCMFFSDLEDED